MKKLLALLLTLVLAFALAAPAFAEEPEPPSAVNWDAFYITEQPQSQIVPHGEGFTLSVKVNAPEGVEVTYQWRNTHGDIVEGATSSTLQLDPDDPLYPQMPKSEHLSVVPYYYRRAVYFCIITANVKDESGNVIDSAKIHSDYANIRIENTVLENLYSVTLEPFVYAGRMALATMLLPFHFIVAPLYFWGFLYERFEQNIKELSVTF